MKGFSLCRTLRTYAIKENVRKYVEMKFLSTSTAEICIYTLKYPMTIKWGALKKMNASIQFGRGKRTEWLSIFLPIKQVADITTTRQLSTFITTYIDF